jgi:glycosyltransferase involved in cell wall biosynthesis
MVKASIVVRTLNEAKHLDQLLTGIKRQALTSIDPEIEIVLVDSGSTDDTLEIASRHGCRIVTIRREEFSFGRSLNLGCDAALGDCLVFVSGHCVPVDDNWLQSLCTPLIEGDAAYTYGRQLGGTNTQFSEKQIFAKYFPATSTIPQAGYYCNNANSAILRHAWAAHHFDEDVTGLEDMQLAKRLVDDGLRIAYVANAGVYHLHDETWPQIQRRFEREALALQEIMPQIHVRQRDLVRYITSSISHDIKQARAEGILLKSIGNIVRYRYHQYLGSYLGNRIHQELSHFEKERYFYPDHNRFANSRETADAATPPSKLSRFV